MSESSARRFEQAPYEPEREQQPRKFEPDARLFIKDTDGEERWVTIVGTRRDGKVAYKHPSTMRDVKSGKVKASEVLKALGPEELEAKILPLEGAKKKAPEARKSPRLTVVKGSRRGEPRSPELPDSAIEPLEEGPNLELDALLDRAEARAEQLQKDVAQANLIAQQLKEAKDIADFSPIDEEMETEPDEEMEEEERVKEGLRKMGEEVEMDPALAALTALPPEARDAAWSKSVEDDVDDLELDEEKMTDEELRKTKKYKELEKSIWPFMGRGQESLLEAALQTLETRLQKYPDTFSGNEYDATRLFVQDYREYLKNRKEKSSASVPRGRHPNYQAAQAARQELRDRRKRVSSESTQTVSPPLSQKPAQKPNLWNRFTSWLSGK